MHKKDYELIASAISFSKQYNYSYIKLSYELAERLASKNPRFNKEKFLKACGVITEIKRKKCNDPCCINNNRTMEGLCDNCK